MQLISTQNQLAKSWLQSRGGVANDVLLFSKTKAAFFPYRIKLSADSFHYHPIYSSTLRKVGGKKKKLTWTKPVAACCVRINLRFSFSSAKTSPDSRSTGHNSEVTGSGLGTPEENISWMVMISEKYSRRSWRTLVSEDLKGNNVVKVNSPCKKKKNTKIIQETSCHQLIIIIEDISHKFSLSLWNSSKESNEKQNNFYVNF